MRSLTVIHQAVRATLRSRRLFDGSWLLLAAAGAVGCGSTTTATVPVVVSPQQTYIAPAMANYLSKSTFAIDHGASTFVQFQYQANAGNEQYVANSGTFKTLSDGILSVGLTYANGDGTQGNLYSPGESGNWAVEWPGQVGFAGLLGEPVLPMVPNRECPSFSTAQTFQFVTLPIAGDKTGVAYGSFSVTTDGAQVNFSNISQQNIAGGTATNPSPATVAGTCAPTFYGQTVSVPDASIVTNPGTGQTETPSATIAIGPSGFLVEDNGYTSNPVAYQNILGAGTGAIGMAVPAAAVPTSSVVAAQYTGFIYNSGAAGNNIKNLTAVPTSSRIASFGYPSVQSACPAPPAPQTATLIYGGEFAANNPGAGGYGNCDFAIDLGTQSSKTNGMYPTATVWIGSTFPGNTTGKSYSIPAAVIVDQVGGKFAMFVIGFDAVGLQVVSQGQQSQDWGIYLLQSN